MTRRKPRSRILTHFMISYLVVLMLPMLTLSFFFLYAFENTLKEEARENLSHPFLTTVDQFDAQLGRLREIALQIELNGDLHGWNLQEASYRYLNIKEELAKYGTGAFFDELYLYTFIDGYVSSINSSCRLEDFNDLILTGSHLEDVIGDFRDTGDSVRILFHAGSADGIDDVPSMLTMMQLPINNRNKFGILLFQQKVSSLNALFSPAIATADTHILLRLDDGSAPLLLGESDAEEQRTLLDLLASPGTLEASSLQHDGETYMLSNRTLPEYGLSITQLYPQDLLVKRISGIRTLFLFSMVALLLLGGFVIAILARINYNPIRKLRAIFEDTLGGKVDIRDRMNELEAVEYALTATSRENASLKDLVENNRHIVQQHLLDAIFSGQSGGIERFGESCRKSGLLFGKEHYRVLAVSSAASACEEDLALLDDLFETIMEERQWEIHAKKDLSGRRITLLLGMDTQSDGDSRTLAMQIFRRLDQGSGVAPHIGIGGDVPTVALAYRSYRESLRALEAAATESSGIVVITDPIIAEKQNFLYPFDLFKDLAAAARSRDAGKCEVSILQVLKHIRSENPPLYWVKNLCFDIVNTVLKEFFHDGVSPMLATKPYIDRIYSAEILSLSDAERIIRELVDDLSEYMQAGDTSYELKLLRQMILYLKGNYSDPNFSLQSLADAIQMSPPYLSQYFKKHTNSSISEYVTRLRMDKAKELLAKPEVNVNDIALQVGYYSVSSFIRKFRETEALTPGQYKKKVLAG